MAELTRNPIDPGSVIEKAVVADCGAVAAFFGVVRDENDGECVDEMEYHGFEEMALDELNAIENDMKSKWAVREVVLTHRLGRLKVREVSVAIVVSSPHRKEALEACAWAIERVKARVPIWKKEFYQGRERWVEGNPASLE